MACHGQPEVRVFLETINPVLGVDFGDKEWHTLRKIIEDVSERALSRARASKIDALKTAENLSKAMNLDEVQRTRLLDSVELSGESHKRGTLDCFDFMADFGPISTIDIVMKISGRPLSKDFLGRHFTLDGTWLIEKQPEAKAGSLAGWKVTKPRNPETPPQIFNTLREARGFVDNQPVEPYWGTRRLDNSTGILTTVCRYRHISNLRNDTETSECPHCQDDLSGFPITIYTSKPEINAEGIFQ